MKVILPLQQFKALISGIVVAAYFATSARKINPSLIESALTHDRVVC